MGQSSHIVKRALSRPALLSGKGQSLGSGASVFLAPRLGFLLRNYLLFSDLCIPVWSFAKGSHRKEQERRKKW